MPLVKSDNIYLGDTSVKKMYLNGALIFQNFTFIKVTAITLDNLVWAKNIPASGGTATKENCTYSVTAYYSDGTTSDVTLEATITGSQVIPSTNIGEVHSAGTLTLTASYSGFTATGNVTVYQEAVDFSTKPLTFNILSDGAINWASSDSSVTRTIEYKLNNGEWASITSNTGSSAPTITVNSGYKLHFRGNNAQYATNNSIYNSFSGSTAGFEVEGNIMSLINSTNFDTLTTLESSYTFNNLFNGCSKLVSAQNLVLPAMTLAKSCYRNMFYNCTSLATAPELPATKLAQDCYSSMFSNCKSLITAPVLPASEILNGCYWFMFSSCYSLTTAPAILATTLKSFSCYGMFSSCGKLNYIKCLATEIESNSTSNWVTNVSSTGTFVKASSMTSWTTGANGIPTNWTVVNNS